MTDPRFDYGGGDVYDAGVIQPGQVLAGKFQIERVLGQGGMGVVVAAQHLQLGQLVALKFLLPEAMRSPETTERFLREARASVRLKSEHVGRVIDVGTLDTGSPYIVMEYLEGEDLEAFVRQHTRLPVVQAVDFVLQASEAIAEAHSIGIIHRDLKPANLFLTVRADGTPSVKVLDFGISKATQDGSVDFSLTRTATVMGSPGYMSPEQLRSARDVDARTDVWALGVILFELVSGRAPFHAETITELTLKVAMDPTPPLGVVAPPGFEEVIRKCLAKDPDARFGSVAELAAALAPFGPPRAAEMAQRIARVQAGLSTNVRQKSAVPIATAPTTLSASTGVSPSGVVTPPAKKRTGLWIALGVALVAAAVAAVVVLQGGGGGEAPSMRAGGAGTGAATGTAAVPPIGTGAGTAVEAGTGSAVTAGTGTGSGAPDDVATGTGTGTGTAVEPAVGSGSAAAIEPTATGSKPRGGKPGKPRGGKPGTGTSPGTGAGTGEPDFSNSRY